LSDHDNLTQEDLLAASYPSFTFDLSEDTEEQFDLISPKDVIDAFSRSFDLPTESGRAILLEAVDAFIFGMFGRFEQRSEKQDNAALTKVAAKAEQLADALLQLVKHPNLEAQLEDRIRGFHALAVNYDGLSLPDLLGTRRAQFRFFRDLLIDLQACSEETRNHKPKHGDYYSDFDFEGMPTAQERYEEDEAEWKSRSHARKLGKDYPLHCFLLSILPHWQSHVGLPFTEGMYFKELQETLSPAISMLHPIVERIDTEITPQRVASSIRKLRESSKL
jgi:hypothetical protein